MLEKLIFLFSAIIFVLLIYLLIKNKAALKKALLVLDEKESKIKSLRQYAYEVDMRRIERDHEVEKSEILFNQSIKELELQKKEGLKSQIVMKIDEYQNRRTLQLKRVNLTQS